MPPWPKGVSGNPSGRNQFSLAACQELRAALASDRTEIHAALMKLVREGNPQAVIYAHRQLVGEVPEFVKQAEEEPASMPSAEDAAAAAAELQKLNELDS